MKQSIRKIALPAVVAIVALTAGLSAQTADSSAPASVPSATQPAAPAAGPEHHHGGRRHFGPMQRLGFRRQVAEKLGLTTEQKSQIETARQSARQQLQAIRHDTTLTPEEKKARIRSLVENTRQQMKQVLTPEQQQRFEQLRAEHQAARRQAQTSPTP